MQVLNLKILDTTNYPNTLDPLAVYAADDPLTCSEIMAIKSQRDEQMLSLELMFFTYPGSQSCCPLQKSK